MVAGGRVERRFRNTGLVECKPEPVAPDMGRFADNDRDLDTAKRFHQAIAVGNCACLVMPGSAAGHPGRGRDYRIRADQIRAPVFLALCCRRRALDDSHLRHDVVFYRRLLLRIV